MSARKRILLAADEGDSRSIRRSENCIRYNINIDLETLPM